MQRVLVIGCSGTGKSTFARALGVRTGLPVVHLDRLFWQPNWVQTPRDLYIARLKEVVARPQWIMDGVNASTLDLRVPRADAIVWLQHSLPICYWRIMKRVIGSYGQVRPDMAEGCPEQFDWEFLRYVWRFRRLYEPRIIDALDRHHAWPRTVTLRGDAQSAAYLRDLPAA
jgi:adenylate kinase family enzyme